MLHSQRPISEQPQLMQLQSHIQIYSRCYGLDGDLSLPVFSAQPCYEDPDPEESVWLL